MVNILFVFTSCNWNRAQRGGAIGAGAGAGIGAVIGRQSNNTITGAIIGAAVGGATGVIIGNYCWLHSGIFIPLGVVLEDFVFVYPHVVFTNDKNPPSSTLSGAHVGKYAQIGAAATLMPGIEIGENAMIGAGSVVTKNVAPFTLVAGNPAVVLKKLHPENILR